MPALSNTDATSPTAHMAPEHWDVAGGAEEQNF